MDFLLGPHYIVEVCRNELVVHISVSKLLVDDGLEQQFEVDYSDHLPPLRQYIVSLYPHTACSQHKAHVVLVFEQIEHVKKTPPLDHVHYRLHLDDILYLLLLVGSDSQERSGFNYPLNIVPGVSIHRDDGQVVLVQGLEHWRCQLLFHVQHDDSVDGDHDRLHMDQPDVQNPLQDLYLFRPITVLLTVVQLEKGFNVILGKYDFVLVMSQPGVQEPGDGLYKYGKDELQEFYKSGHFVGDWDLVCPSAVGLRKDFPHDQNGYCGDKDGEVRGYYFVQENGQRLHTQGISEQEGAQQQVVILQNGQYGIGSVCLLQVL